MDVCIVAVPSWESVLDLFNFQHNAIGTKGDQRIYGRNDFSWFEVETVNDFVEKNNHFSHREIISNA